jgi:hypothetical protein
MKIREHRGGLDESIATTEVIEPNINALIAHVKKKLTMQIEVNKDNLHIKKYGSGIDDRCGWDTHIVTIDGYGVFGWTDGPLKP